MKTQNTVYGRNVHASNSRLRGFFRNIVAALGWCLLSCSQAFASDPIGIYAIVDKVIIEPKDGAPERIQVWGTFTQAQGRGDSYTTPEQGYLYFKLPTEKAEVAAREWKDIQSVAGKPQAIGFGARYEEKGTIRKASQKPEAPDTYPLGFGLKKVEEAPKDYPALRGLFEAAEKTRGKAGAKS
jgi:hypothetical protein